ncbi:MAG: LON peptidase substrate-binding domain-containing protein [Rubricoccaceae bacterium]|nr:LON peptidase substrate-binding domain-containing protein [Rubricoccaceae bacterium]
MGLPERLPIFPLGIVLYPGEPVPLHIFEPRYREMVRVCQEDDLPFGIVHVSEEALAEVGCTARIRRVLNHYDDGRLDIVALGEQRFRIVEIFRDRVYLSAEVEPFGPERLERVDASARERVITQHMKLLEMAGETIRPAVYEQARWVSFVVAQNAGLEIEQKQQLLEMQSENDRVAYLIQHFSDLLQRVARAKRLRALSQGDGHATGWPEL